MQDNSPEYPPRLTKLLKLVDQAWHRRCVFLKPTLCCVPDSRDQNISDTRFEILLMLLNSRPPNVRQVIGTTFGALGVREKNRSVKKPTEQVQCSFSS